MKTLNRPTAPSPFTEADLSALCTAVRNFSAFEPQAEGADREELITSLHTLDIDLERLSIREAVDALEPVDRAEIERCRRELARLGRFWFTDGGPDGEAT